MEDRELLELAAKAAALVGKVIKHPNCDPYFVLDFNKMPWAPLVDDGDALRLALKLDIYVMVVAEEGKVSARRRNKVRTTWVERISDDSDNAIYTAARRAIVRAAAGTARGM